MTPDEVIPNRLASIPAAGRCELLWVTGVHMDPGFRAYVSQLPQDHPAVGGAGAAAGALSLRVRDFHEAVVAG